MVGLLRRLRVLRSARVGKSEAEQLAIAECHRRGWPWQDPVQVNEGFTYWHFMTNADQLGGNVNIFIDSRTGAVRKAGFARR